MGDTSPAEAAAVPQPELLVCAHCDAVYRRAALRPSQQARCARCRAVLGRGHRISLDGMLALSVAALVVFAIANLQPLVQLNLGGVHNETSLPGAIEATWRSGQRSIAVLAAAVGFVFPLLLIVLRLYVLVPVWARRMPPRWQLAMRLLEFASRWSMVEVLVLSVLVSLVRITGMASVVPGVGLYAVGVLTLLLAALESSGEHRLWECADRIDE